MEEERRGQIQTREGAKENKSRTRERANESESGMEWGGRRERNERVNEREIQSEQNEKSVPWPTAFAPREALFQREGEMAPRLKKKKQKGQGLSK
jgi:hypothetical protein